MNNQENIFNPPRERKKAEKIMMKNLLVLGMNLYTYIFTRVVDRENLLYPFISKKTYYTEKNGKGEKLSGWKLS